MAVRTMQPRNLRPTLLLLLLLALQYVAGGSYVVVPTAYAGGRALWHQPEGTSPLVIGGAMEHAQPIEQRIAKLEAEHRRLDEQINAEWEAPALKRRKLRVRDELERMRRLAADASIAPLVRQLGYGAEARVLLGRSLDTGEMVALKCEPARPLEHSPLHREYRAMRKLGGARGFAHALEFIARAEVLGEPADVLVLDLLGPSVDELYWATLEACADEQRADTADAGPRRGLSPRTALVLLHDALGLLGRVRARGLVHNDVKPDNLLMGRLGRRRELVHLVDFGSSCALGSGARAPAADDAALVGTARFASAAAHGGARGRESPAEARSTCDRDDVESLLYSMASICMGELPWDRLLEADGSIRAGRERELRGHKEAALDGTDGGRWALGAALGAAPPAAADTDGADAAQQAHAVFSSLLLELMAHLRERQPGARGPAAGAGVDFGWARAAARAAHAQLAGSATLCRTSFDWDTLGITWPEAADEVARAVAERARLTAAAQDESALADDVASGRPPGRGNLGVRVVGGVGLIWRRDQLDFEPQRLR